MARPWRIQYNNAVYHIMSRGVAEGEIFCADEDYHKFLEYLEKISERFHLEVFVFVLMGNHYHLFLRTQEENLSRAMQWLQTSYSVYFNRKHRRSGHLFQGRYKSILVGEDSYWRGLSFYVHLNPVRCQGANPKRSLYDCHSEQSEESHGFATLELVTSASLAMTSTGQLV